MVSDDHQADVRNGLRVLLNTAPHDKAVSEGLAVATTRYRDAFVPIARRFMDLGALREELDLNQAVDAFWFYFGYSGLLLCMTRTGGATSRPNAGSAARPAGLCCEIVRLKRKKRLDSKRPC